MSTDPAATPLTEREAVVQALTGQSIAWGNRRTHLRVEEAEALADLMLAAADRIRPAQDETPPGEPRAWLVEWTVDDAPCEELCDNAEDAEATAHGRRGTVTALYPAAVQPPVGDPEPLDVLRDWTTERFDCTTDQGDTWRDGWLTGYGEAVAFVRAALSERSTRG